MYDIRFHDSFVMTRQLDYYLRTGKYTGIFRTGRTGIFKC